MSKLIWLSIYYCYHYYAFTKKYTHIICRHVHKTISKEIRKTEEELRNSKVKKEKEFQNCLTHAEQLDNLNKQLQAQVSHCGRNLHTFQFVCFSCILYCCIICLL